MRRETALPDKPRTKQQWVNFWHLCATDFHIIAYNLGIMWESAADNDKLLKRVCQLRKKYGWRRGMR
jgi:hypothetical protein